MGRANRETFESDGGLPENEAHDESGYRVVVRVRPALGLDPEKEKAVRVISGTRLRVDRIDNGELEVKVDCALGPEVKQADVFQVFRDMVVGTFRGMNNTILAYGQTGSGKTYTMTGGAAAIAGEVDARELSSSLKESHRGIIPRALETLFRQMDSQAEVDGTIAWHMYISFMENYNERIYDLLASNTPTAASQVSAESWRGSQPKRDPLAKGGSSRGNGLDVREARDGSVSVPGLTVVEVKNINQALEVLRIGTAKRTCGDNGLNPTSSRSHSIFQLVLEKRLGSRMSNHERQIMQASKLNLVDLAGSEKMRPNANVSHTVVSELTSINLSLSALGQCIAALVDRRSHMPCRDSKLTRLLQDSLRGTSQTAMCVCLSPTVSSLEESMSSLKFADRAKRAVLDKPQSVAPQAGDAAPQRQIEHLAVRVEELTRELQEERRARQQLEGLLHLRLGGGSWAGNGVGSGHGGTGGGGFRDHRVTGISVSRALGGASMSTAGCGAADGSAAAGGVSGIYIPADDNSSPRNAQPFSSAMEFRDDVLGTKSVATSVGSTSTERLLGASCVLADVPNRSLNGAVADISSCLEKLTLQSQDMRSRLEALEINSPSPRGSEVLGSSVHLRDAQEPLQLDAASDEISSTKSPVGFEGSGVRDAHDSLQQSSEFDRSGWEDSASFPRHRHPRRGLRSSSSESLPSCATSDSPGPPEPEPPPSELAESVSSASPHPKRWGATGRLPELPSQSTLLGAPAAAGSSGCSGGQAPGEKGNDDSRDAISHVRQTGDNDAQVYKQVSMESSWYRSSRNHEQAAGRSASPSPGHARSPERAPEQPHRQQPQLQPFRDDEMPHQAQNQQGPAKAVVLVGENETTEDGKLSKESQTNRRYTDNVDRHAGARFSFGVDVCQAQQAELHASRHTEPVDVLAGGLPSFGSPRGERHGGRPTKPHDAQGQQLLTPSSLQAMRDKQAASASVLVDEGHSHNAEEGHRGSPTTRTESVRPATAAATAAAAAAVAAAGAATAAAAASAGINGSHQLPVGVGLRPRRVSAANWLGSNVADDPRCGSTTSPEEPPCNAVDERDREGQGSGGGADTAVGAVGGGSSSSSGGVGIIASLRHQRLMEGAQPQTNPRDRRASSNEQPQTPPMSQPSTPCACRREPPSQGLMRHSTSAWERNSQRLLPQPPTASSGAVDHSGALHSARSLRRRGSKSPVAKAGGGLEGGCHAVSHGALSGLAGAGSRGCPPEVQPSVPSRAASLFAATAAVLRSDQQTPSGESARLERSPSQLGQQTDVLASARTQLSGVDRAAADRAMASVTPPPRLRRRQHQPSNSFAALPATAGMTTGRDSAEGSSHSPRSAVLAMRSGASGEGADRPQQRGRDGDQSCKSAAVVAAAVRQRSARGLRFGGGKCGDLVSSWVDGAAAFAATPEKTVPHYSIATSCSDSSVYSSAPITKPRERPVDVAPGTATKKKVSAREIAAQCWKEFEDTWLDDAS